MPEYSIKREDIMVMFRSLVSNTNKATNRGFGKALKAYGLEIFEQEVIAINSIFIGMLLVFLNFSLDIGASKIGLIPNFIGYYFMLKGLVEIAELSDRFSKIMPYVKGMIVYSGICYVIDLFGVSIAIEWSLLALGLISMILSLFISYNIIIGIKDIEVNKRQNLNSEQLYSAWKLMVVFSVLTYVLLLIPMLAIISILASFAIGIYYLYAFNKTKLLFNEQNY